MQSFQNQSLANYGGDSLIQRHIPPRFNRQSSQPKRDFTAVTRVRIPSGTPYQINNLRKVSPYILGCKGHDLVPFLHPQIA